MRRPLRSFVLLALGVASCTSSATTTTVVPVTGLSVDPHDFLGAVTCGEGPDRMHAFVATLVDMSGFEQSYLAAGERWKDGGFDELSLPSSAPATCFVPVIFQRIVVGRQYRAEIDGYDRDAVTLQPLSPGSRIMVDAKSKAYVAPRWTTSCGSHWAPPRDADAGAKSTDAGTATDGAAPDGRAPEPAHIAEQRPDGAVVFGDCRGNRLLDSGADGEPAPRPWLGGPVCASFETTIPVRGCDPLRDHGAAK